MKPRKPKPYATIERIRELFNYDPDTGVFTRRLACRAVKAGRIEGYIDPKGYRRIYVDRRLYMAHRVAWAYVHGTWPADQIDHENHVRDDNRIANLRECTNAENRQNIKPQGYGISGYLGVVAHSQYDPPRWVASIGLNGKRIYLGTYDTAEEAAAVYAAAKTETHYFAAGRGSVLGGASV